MADLAKSINYIRSLKIQEKEHLIEKISKKQPNLLAHVLALPLVGASYKNTEIVLEILMILYNCFTEFEHKKLPIISEDVLESIHENNTALMKLFENESNIEKSNIIQQSFDGYLEKNVLAFVVGYLNDTYFVKIEQNFQHCILASKNILDSFVKLKHGKI